MSGGYTIPRRALRNSRRSRLSRAAERCGGSAWRAHPRTAQAPNTAGARACLCDTPARHLGEGGHMSDGPRVQLFVVRGFEVRVDGAPMRLPTNVARVLAYLALQRRPQRRAAVAAALWMDVPDTRASANLRTALWQARRLLAGFVLADATRIALHESVHVDLWAAVEQASRLGRDGEPLHSDDTDADLLGGELLPEWDEEWIVAERERFRLLRMHALETLSRKLTAAG